MWCEGSIVGGRDGIKAKLLAKLESQKAELPPDHRSPEIVQVDCCAATGVRACNLLRKISMEYRSLNQPNKPRIC
jgi:hypothetical protein